MGHDADQPPLSFSNPVKVRRQMIQHGWTESQVREAMITIPIAAIGQHVPALRYSSDNWQIGHRGCSNGKNFSPGWRGISIWLSRYL